MGLNTPTFSSQMGQKNGKLFINQRRKKGYAKKCSVCGKWLYRKHSKTGMCTGCIIDKKNEKQKKLRK